MDTFKLIGEVLLSVAAFVGAVVTLRKHLVIPLIAFSRKVLDVLERINTNAHGMERLAREVEALAGALVEYAMANRDKLQEHAEEIGELKNRVTDLGMFLADIEAEVNRLPKRSTD